MGLRANAAQQLKEDYGLDPLTFLTPPSCPRDGMIAYAFSQQHRDCRRTEYLQHRQPA